MKIYIPDILPIKLKNKLTELNKLCNPLTTIIYELTSKNSPTIFIKNNEKYFFETTFNNNYELIKNYNSIDLLVDKTEYSKIDVVSQLPIKYILTKKIEYRYKLSQISLVIDCIKDGDNENDDLTPIDFYFILNSEKVLDLKNIFIQEELNMFLSNIKQQTD